MLRFTVDGANQPDLLRGPLSHVGRGDVETTTRRGMRGPPLHFSFFARHPCTGAVPIFLQRYLSHATRIDPQRESVRKDLVVALEEVVEVGPLVDADIIELLLDFELELLRCPRVVTSLFGQ